MRPASILAAAAGLGAATPALATSTLLCRSTISPADGPALSLAVGNGPGTGILQARFELGDTSFDTGEGPSAPVIGQAWIDEHSLRLDLVDANAEGRIVRLDARRRGGSDYRGILIYAGRTWRVRCTEEG
jgi:hypothetical protein